MKHLWVICLVVLMAGSLLAQNSMPGSYDRAQLIKTYTNYTYETADTTSWISYPDLLQCSYVALIKYQTDSAHADLYIMGRNTALPAAATTKYVDTFVDSIPYRGGASTALAPRVTVRVLKGPGIDHLEGCNQLRIGTVFKNAAETGITSGRQVLYYLVWKYQ
jgi:hypothetical protein